MTDRRGTPRKIRWAGALAALLAAAFTLGLGTAQAREKKSKAEPGLPDRISSLGKKLYGLDIDDAKPITDEIQKLVVDHLNSWIAHRTPNIIEVRHELEQMFSKLEYPAVGTPAIFIAPWKNLNLIGAGYTLGWSNIWRINVLVIYENQNGESRQITTADFLPRTDMHFTVMKPSPDGKFRFLAYGWRLGMSHPRLSAVLYAFDGKGLESQWQIDNLFDGKLNANNDTVVISYVDRDEYIRQTQQGHMPARHQKIYKVTPEGMQLESEHDVPFGT